MKKFTIRAVEVACQETFNDVPTATFSMTIKDGTTEVFGGSAFGPLPVGRTLSITGTLFKDGGGPDLTNTSLEIRVDGQTIYSEEVAGPVAKLTAVPPGTGTVTASGPGCFEILINGVVDSRFQIGTIDP